MYTLVFFFLLKLLENGKKNQKFHQKLTLQSLDLIAFSSVQYACSQLEGHVPCLSIGLILYKNYFNRVILCKHLFPSLVICRFSCDVIIFQN